MSQVRDRGPRVPTLGEFQVGEWTVRQDEGTLSLGAQSVRLEPRVMDVLVCLASEPGRVIAKEELLDAVWGEAYVEEGALSQAIHLIRKALGDDARQPRYIQTIPKRGYRLVVTIMPAQFAGVEELEPKDPEPGFSSTPVKSSDSKHGWQNLPRWLQAVIIGVLIGFAFWAGRYLLSFKKPVERPTSAVTATEWKRIVVLPFENLGGRAEDAYFADGITEEITKDLSSLPSLKVISRTSAKLSQGKPLSTLRRELRVDYVLVGTVQWAQGTSGKTKVKITPQLIRVADDTQVWSDSFEVNVNDIFDVQAEISVQVIGSLGSALLPIGKRRPRLPPTNNLEAYRAYLRGVNLRNQPYYSEKHIRLAVPMFERAVALDPGFAVAWAELSQTHSYLAFNADPSPAEVARSREALENALAIDPNLPEVRLAQAYFSYRCLEDYKAAEGQLAAAASLSPNDAEILQMLGYVLRRQGRMEEAIKKLRQAFSLDPKTVRILWAIAETFRALRKYDKADRYYSQAISLAPDQPTYWEEKALNRLDWTGDINQAQAVLAESPIKDDPQLTAAFFLLDLYRRHYSRADARLTVDNLNSLALQADSRLITLRAIVLERSGDHLGALAAAESNRIALEERVKRFPMEFFYRAYLAVALGQLGRREEAISRIKEALESANHDRFSGPRVVEIQAMLEVTLGRRGEAIALLERLLALSYQAPISVADLQLSPIWDPLRDEPAFQTILKGRPQ
jgi:DNA-binding winged helix-turn-helix (wHTH) protein/TolB-like protein/cytochrome c-type biogenesis protein CcmH/NrfG